MGRLLRFIESQANRIGVWVSAVTAMTGGYAWIASHLVAFKPYGWPEATLAGLFLALSTMLVLSVGLVAWRYFNPIPVPQFFQGRDTKEYARDPAPHSPIPSPELAIGLRKEIADANAKIGSLTAMVSKLQHDTAVGLPNASTVVEAFRNLEQAVQSQIARISEETQRFSDSQRTAAFDLLLLLSAAVDRATISTMKGLLKERPVYDKMAPPADNETRIQQIENVRHWLVKVSSVTATAAYGQDIYMTLGNSKHEAESDARQVPPDQRPPIDALAFHDFYVAAYRSESVGDCLEYVIRQVEKNERHALDRFREALAARQKRNN